MAEEQQFTAAQVLQALGNLTAELRVHSKPSPTSPTTPLSQLTKLALPHNHLLPRQRRPPKRPGTLMGASKEVMPSFENSIYISMANLLTT